MSKDTLTDAARQALGFLRRQEVAYDDRVAGQYADKLSDALNATPAQDQQAEPVGYAGYTPVQGFTAAFFPAENVPDGAPLYTTPPAPASQPAAQGVPDGWELRHVSDECIMVTSPDGVRWGVVKGDSRKDRDEKMGAHFFDLCSALLTASPTPPAQQGEQ